MLHRIKWTIRGKESGHGNWHETTAVLDAWVSHLNKRYGAGSHWIETNKVGVAT